MVKGRGWAKERGEETAKAKERGGETGKAKERGWEMGTAMVMATHLKLQQA